MNMARIKENRPPCDGQFFLAPDRGGGQDPRIVATVQYRSWGRGTSVYLTLYSEPRIPFCQTLFRIMEYDSLWIEFVRVELLDLAETEPFPHTTVFG